MKMMARCPQVTVPVAGENELGRAFHKLHVRAQPAGGSDCAKQPYEDLDATLKRLLRKPSITVYRRTTGTTLTRRFLYRTKAEYAK
jgi:hypothetical protein